MSFSTHYDVCLARIFCLCLGLGRFASTTKPLWTSTDRLSATCVVPKDSFFTPAVLPAVALRGVSRNARMTLYNE